MAEHVWLLAMPQTALVALLAGIVLGAYLWADMKRVDAHHIASLWIVGASFLVCMGFALASFGMVRWDAWAGLGILWSVYVLAAGASCYVWRHIRARIHGRALHDEG
jgi:hypothetical protein